MLRENKLVHEIELVEFYLGPPLVHFGPLCGRIGTRFFRISRVSGSILGFSVGWKGLERKQISPGDRARRVLSWSTFGPLWFPLWANRHEAFSNFTGFQAAFQVFL